MFLFALFVGCSPHSETITVQVNIAEPSTESVETVTDQETEEEFPNEPADTNSEASADEVDTDSVCGDREVGTDVGMCGENFMVPNAQGEMIALHDFAGDIIFLDMSGFT